MPQSTNPSSWLGCSTTNSLFLSYCSICSLSFRRLKMSLRRSGRPDTNFWEVYICFLFACICSLYLLTWLLEMNITYYVITWSCVSLLYLITLLRRVYPSYLRLYKITQWTLTDLKNCILLTGRPSMTFFLDYLLTSSSGCVHLTY